MANEEKLLPCPFCGGEAEHDPAHFDGHNPVRDHIGHAIYCADMTCVGCPSFSQTYETEAEAVAAWNRRASTIERLSAIEQERHALREALTKPHTIAARMRQIAQDVWDKRPGYTDRQAWSDLHGQAMQLLEWDMSAAALNQTRTDASEAPDGH